jgi:AraC family transcriptional activator of tynA and feaB
MVVNSGKLCHAGNEMIPVRTFTTDRDGHFGPREFQTTMASLFSVGLAIHELNGIPFWSRVDTYEGENLRFASLRFSEHATTSARSTIQSSRLLVTVQKEGWSIVEQHGRAAKVAPGSLYLIDPSESFLIETSEMLTHSVYLPKSILRSLVADIEDMTAMPIDVQSGAGAMMGSMLDHLFEMGPSLNELTADRIADALPYVLSAAISPSSSEARLPEARLRSMHRRRVMQAVQEHLFDPALSAEFIAEKVQLSTRRVHSLFEDQEETLMKSVWSMRLRQCAADLRRPELSSRSISEIAFRWGYSDAAHFSRTFKKRYNCSPRQWRQNDESDPEK